MNKILNLGCVVAYFGLTHCASAAVIYYSSHQYRGRTDNPFLAGLIQNTMYLDNFETRNVEKPPYNYLVTPFAQGWNGRTVGGLLSGVQEDFSAEGMGWVWDTSGGSAATSKPPTGIHFDFTTDVTGRLPEYVGAALAGFGLTGSSPAFNVILVYDRNGVEVTEGQWRIPRPDYSLPYKEEDLYLDFEGIYVPGGISRIHFRDFVGVDHLTYGYAIPESSTGLLTLAAGALMLARRSRSRKSEVK